ncbi:MAG: sugar ABC transporter substrate-binding protein [Limnochordia bacterium]|nr:sugar ABC transporter substrate-binding protein [Limnochordia bacterium]
MTINHTRKVKCMLTIIVLLGMSFLFSLNADAKIKLTLATWTGGIETTYIETIVGEFMKANPNIEVEVVLAHGGPWGRDKYLVMWSGGTVPDLLLLNSGNFENFANRGMLYPLNDFVKNDPDFDLDKYFPVAIEGSSLFGTLYGLPYDVSNHVPYYNKDLFDQQGLTEPGDWTWDDLIAKAKKLTKDIDGDGLNDVFGLGISAHEWYWDSIKSQFDAPLFNEDGTEVYADSQAFVDFMTWYYDLTLVECVAPYDAWGGDWFIDQRVAIATFGPWYRPELEAVSFSYDVAVPAKGTRRGTVYYVDQFAIASSTEYPQEAWELLKFLTGEEGWDLKMSVGYGGRAIPPLREYGMSNAFLDYWGVSNHIFLEALEYSDRSVAGLPSGVGREFLDLWWPRMWEAWVTPQPLRPILEDIQTTAIRELGLK